MPSRMLPFLFILVAAIGVNAQTSNSEVRALLLKSYALAQHLPAETRADILGRQAMIAGDVDEQLAGNWAEELYILSGSIREDRRPAVRQLALVDMIGADPVRAYAMARQMEPPKDNPAVWVVYDNIVDALWERQGEASLAKVQSILSDLSGTDNYPYRATQQLVRQLSESNPEVAEIIFRDAAASYAKAPSKARHFDRFLMGVWMALPAEVVRPVLTGVVDNLLADTSTREDFGGRLIATDKTVTEFHSPSTAGLIMLMPAMHQLDPQLLEKAAAARTEVAIALNGGALSMQAGTVNPNPDSPTNRPFRVMRTGGGGIMISPDPDEALAAARAIPDVEKRSLALANLAQRMPWPEAPQARVALLEANALVPQMKNQQAVLTVLTAVVQDGHRIGETALENKAVARGFAVMSGLNEKLSKLDTREHEGFDLANTFDNFAEAVGEVDTKLVTKRLDDYPSPAIQARLLVEAAAGKVRAMEQKREETEIRKMRGMSVERKQTPDKSAQ